MTRKLLCVLTGILCLGSSLSQDLDCEGFDTSTLNPANDADYCRYQIDVGKRPVVGQVCLAHPEDVFPTQAAFGEVDANCVQQGLEKKAQAKDGSLKKYLSEHQAPAVLGPNGTVYITDHHHLSVALLRAFLPYEKPYFHRTLYVCIAHDFSQLPEKVFWKGMQEKALVFLQDNFGKPITEKELPTSVKYLRDDPYRTLAMWARNSFGFVKCGQSETKKFKQCDNGNVEAKPFIEFRWGNLFRTRFPSKGIYTESDQMQVLSFEGYLNDVIKFATDPMNKHMEGFNEEPVFVSAVSLDAHGCIVDTPPPPSNSDSGSSGGGSSEDEDVDSDSDSSSDDDDLFETVVLETSEWFKTSLTT